MLNVVSTPHAHLVRLRFGDRYTVADIDRAAVAIDQALEQSERINLLIEAGPLSEIEPAAMWKDLLYGLSKLGSLSRFPRVAVVTDVAWMRRAAEIEHHVLPYIVIRTFKPGELGDALAWVEELPPAHPIDGPSPGTGLTLIPTGQPDLVACAIDGRPTQGQVEIVVNALNGAFADAGGAKINLLLRVDRMDRVPLVGLGRAEVWAAKWRSLAHVDRYALVGAPAWLANLMSFLDPILAPTMRTFDRGDEAAAWTWVRGTEQTPDVAAF